MKTANFKIPVAQWVEVKFHRPVPVTRQVARRIQFRRAAPRLTEALRLFQPRLKSTPHG